MKTTGAGDQVLPVRLASKPGVAGKEARPQPSGGRFDDVLSGLNAGAARRPAAPLSMPAIAGAREMRGAEKIKEPGVASDALHGEGGLLASMPIAVPQQTPTLNTTHASAAHRAPAERQTARAAVSVAPVAAERSAAKTPREVQAEAAPGAPSRRLATGPTGDAKSAQSPRAADLATATPARALAVSSAGIEGQPPQPFVLPATPLRDPRRAPVAGTRQATAPETVVGREATADGGEEVSLLDRETHFRPVVTKRDASAPSGRSTDDGPRHPVDQVRPPHAGPASPDRIRSDAVGRVEPQGRPGLAPTPPLLQVGAAVLQDIAEGGADSPDFALVLPANVPASESREPLRMLKVALEPEDLGRVTVRMRLTGRNLDLKVTAERADTASLLERDRHLLAKILRESGYSADDVTIQAQAPGSPTAPSAVRSPEAQAGGQGTQQFPSGGSTDGDRQPPGSRNARGERLPQETHGDEADRDPRRSGAHYV